MKTKELLRRYRTEVFYSEEDEGFIAYFLELGMNASGWGETREDALKELDNAATLVIGVLKKDGKEIPEPFSLQNFSGKFVLRTSPEHHRELIISAKRAGKSLNQFVNRKLGLT